jgi:hypothetical protein
LREVGEHGGDTAPEWRRRVAEFLEGTDAALLRAVAKDDRHAWVALLMRVRPPMEEWARRSGVPHDDWPECIDDVIEDVVLRLRAPGKTAPEHIVAYFVEAARLKFRMVLRARQARLARLLTLADGPPVPGSAGHAVVREQIVTPLASEYARYAALPPGDERETIAPALARMAVWIRDQLSEADQRILGWQAYGAPHRRIAEWLGVSYEAATKRVWRLTRRARALAERYAAEHAPANDLPELERFFNRARGGASHSSMIPPPPRRGGSSGARGGDHNRTSRRDD